jgi:uncharacterized protein (DUF433 family)
MVSAAGVLERAYRVPIYSQVEAARIVGTSSSSLSRWTRSSGGRRFGSVITHPALITSIHEGRGRTVPFVGLAEAYVIAAFRAAGLSMQRIRPAVEALRSGIGLEHALISERLRTDGAEILLEAERDSPDGEAADRRLVVVRNGQAVFREVVDKYLRGIRYRGGFVASLQVPHYSTIDVVVDLRINAGSPTVARRGVRVGDVMSRVEAGEAKSAVADDYRLTAHEMRALLSSS